MYSRSAMMREETQPLPPRYSGVRFRRERRADGRDIAVETPLKPPEPKMQEALPALPAVKEPAPPQEKGGLLSDLLCSVGKDDLLLAALIIILAGESGDNREAVLLLLFLLCIR